MILPLLAVCGILASGILLRDPEHRILAGSTLGVSIVGLVHAILTTGVGLEYGGWLAQVDIAAYVLTGFALVLAVSSLPVRRPLPRWLPAVLGSVSIVVILALYTWVAWEQKLANPNDTTIPSWPQLWAGFLEMVTPDRRDDVWLLVDSIATGIRFFGGLGLSIVLAIVLGLLMGTNDTIEALLLPPLSVAAKVVPTAAMAVFFVVVGLDLEMYWTMIVFGVTPSLAISVQLAARGVPRNLIDKAYTLGASHSEVIWGVIFPAVLPKLLDAVRLAIGPALVYLIAAEMLVGDEGFGYRIRLLQRRLDMNVVYLYIAVLAAFGYGMDYGLRGLQRALCPWYAER